MPVLLRLQRNLGHPSSADLVRILRHGQASEQALRLAKELQCPFCQSHAKPHAALPAHPVHVTEFNQQIGIDVKHLPGWRANQKVLSLNIVDTASGYQRVIPFFETETSRLLWQLLKDHWIAWAGPPREIILDPKATNLGEPLVIPLEQQGIHVRQIAAGAHYQLGKVESHGGWFERVLKKVVDEHSPQGRDEWLECVLQTHVKNAMIQNHGVTPHQFVFGRNPHVPSDLLNEPQSAVATTASTTDAALAKFEAIRTSARHAIVQLQDSRAMRMALLARPRVATHFEPGSLVAYWRCQKWIQGRLVQGGQWYGTAVVLGNVGRNLIIAHRKQILRAAPEQLRLATSEEKQLLNTSGAELLGIKDLIEGGAFKSQQYVDLTSQAYPSEQSDSLPIKVTDDMDVETPKPEDTSVKLHSHVMPVPEESYVMPPLVPSEAVPVSTPSESKAAVSSEPSVPTGDTTVVTSDMHVDPGVTADPESEYGPIRRKVTGKNGPGALWRPATTKQEDFVSIMKEVVPHLIQDMVPPSSTASSSKRSLETSTEGTVDEPATARMRTVSPNRPADEASAMHSSSESHEVLSAECMDSTEVSCEALIAEYLQRRAEKELPHSRNPPELQAMVDAGKRAEWTTLINKENVIKLHYGKAAARIKKDYAHRFIGSRFVLTRKPLEEGATVDPHDYKSFSVKGRWCLQGHLDPDLNEKALTGKLQSPTLNQMSRMCLMQIISSHGWDLQLGDIKGAFLESGMIEEKYRPLYASMPPGGIPGVDPEAVIEVLGNVYGQNDAPSAWFSTFDEAAQSFGWRPSRFDQCLYTLRSEGRLVGIMGVHVDDTALGGAGKVFQDSVAALRSRFPYRKWSINSGEFCGAFYKQDVRTKAIKMSMQTFAENMRHVNIKKGVPSEQPLNPFQIKQLRGINGSLNWLSSQGRPDLSAQTNLSQQAFPNPTIKHLRNANNVIRRARMFRDLTINFEPIHPSQLTVVCHSDAAFANVGTHTQAGYIVAFTEKQLQDGKVARWCPLTWRSYKLPRAVSSTLSAESQAFASASGTTEWLLLLLSEILDGPMSMRQCRDALSRRPPILITDCKSLYDHLVSPSAPTAIEDRRTSIDVVIIRESVRAMQAFVRWVPTAHMLADALTKDQGDPMDALRGCIRSSTCQISPESTVLQQQAKERADRLQRKSEKQLNSFEGIS